MNSVLKKDLQNVGDILDQVKLRSVNFLNSLNALPTYAADQEVVPATLPATGLGTVNTLELFRQNYEKLIVASSGPRYWGFVTGGSTPAGIAGDWLTSIFDQNTQSMKGAGDVSAQIESQAISLMLDLLGLPTLFNGGFVTGATMSNFTGLAVARQWAGKKLRKDIAREGMSSEIVVLAATPHSSVVKSLSMLGFGSNNFIKLKTVEKREALDITDLETKLLQHAGRGVILNCSAGTVNTVDFDDIQKIVSLKEKYDFWLHVDAAFGGFAACSPGHRHLLNGWEQADSITVDCHKWMNVPYDSALILTRNEHKHLQIQSFQNSNAPYLGDPDENFSYLNFLPENSRRFRALPAWFSLMAYGREGFQGIVENCIAHANELARYFEKSKIFRLIAPVRLNVVCFGLKSNTEKTGEFLSLLNSRGKVFITPTTLGGVFCFRAAFVNFRTTGEDIQIAINDLESVAKVVLSTADVVDQDIFKQ